MDEEEMGYPAPQQKKPGMFGKPKQQTADTGLSDQINSLSGRLRMLEERINMANRKIEVGESNMLENQKRNNVDIRQLNSEIIDVKRLIEEIKEKMDVILRELPNLAARDELEVLKRYIEMWEPMKFVTRNELDKILEEKKE